MTLAQVWEVAGPEYFVEGHVQQPIRCIVCKATDTRPMLAAIDPSDQVVLGYYHKHHRASTLVRAGISAHKQGPQQMYGVWFKQENAVVYALKAPSREIAIRRAARIWRQEHQTPTLEATEELPPWGLGPAPSKGPKHD